MGLYTLVNSLVAPTENQEYEAAASIRLGIVTSDMGLQWGDGQTGGNSIPLQYCDQNGVGDDGAIQAVREDVTIINIPNNAIACDPGGKQCPAAFSCVNGFCASSTPGVQTVNCDPSVTGNWAETTSIDPNDALATQVACMAQQGNTGCGVEQQLQAAIRALSRTDQSAFLRDDHVLVVMVVSDEEDCSIQNNGLFQTPEWLSGNDPQGLFNVACNYPESNEQFLYNAEEYFQRFVALKGDQENAVVFAAIVGVPPGDSSLCQGSGEFIKQNGCLDDPAMQIQVQEFSYTDDSGTTSTYNHFRPACTRMEGNEEVTSARPGRRFVESICNPDWSGAMREIARSIAGCIIEK